MKPQVFVLYGLVVLFMCNNAAAEEWSTPEALRAFGKPGDTVKGNSRAKETSKPSQAGNAKNKSGSFAQEASRACTEEITTDCTSYKITGTPPPADEEEPKVPKPMLLIVR
ncbi:MAG: hypothetical protein JJE30_07410 [Desulfuromonadales bacterium]|nr:hypothetical protein [Desulfuromonadales bacterium]